MRKSFLLIVFVAFFAFDIFSQNCDYIKDIDIQVPNDCEEFLEGVKSVNVISQSDDFSEIKEAVYKYLTNMGFEIDYSNKISANCEKASVLVTYTFDGIIISDIGVSFVNPCHEINTANGVELNSYYYQSNKRIKVNLDNIENLQTNFYNALINAYGFKKKEFNSKYTTKLPKKITCWNTTSLKAYYSNLRNISVEGIYESTSNSPKYKLALKKINGILHLIYLSGAKNVDDWQEGEIKATLEPTATKDLYKAYWIMNDKKVDENFYISFENGLINVLDNKKNKDVYLKMFPTTSSNSTPNSGNLPSNLISTGTGFAISSKGYIVTNYHVIEDASSIKVRGINNNFSSSYNASVIASDKNSDLAILKINDSKFTSLGTIPYTISTKTSDVGSSVYVLGYPLLSTMGQEVKVTNGIISSKSGYNGDISTYQVSVPVQPGNSGGPLLDSKGNIIGVINAKHKLAENASYAIKSNYLLNLIESIDQPPVLQSINSLNGKSFTEQLKVVKNFTYIIEIY
jgi:S1-C subfamily serine protease